MSAEQTELAGDLGGEPADVRGRRGGRGRVEEVPQVAIAEAGGGEFAAGHRWASAGLPRWVKHLS
jgi:hypothetical protein